MASGNGGFEEPPLVFICSKCKCVLGDSTSWLESDLADQTVMLKGVSSYVIKDEECTLSTAPLDDYCMIENLFCSGCNTRIGKMYKCTPKHLDYKCDMFFLDIDSIESYVIGSSTEQEIADEPITLELRSEIEVEVSKTKAVLVRLHHKIAN